MSINDDRESLTFLFPPQRVVSLVPSLTESLFELGMGDAVVGITDYCIHPAEAVASLPRLGGTKTPRIDEILNLKPDLVLANQEENTPQTVAALREGGLQVWVSFPQTVDDALQVLRELVGFFKDRQAGLRVDSLARAWDLARMAALENPPIKYFCPIWHAETGNGVYWWMTFNAQTYPHAVLAGMGGENVFAARQRRYPLEADLGEMPPRPPEGADTRYPRVTLAEVMATAPELILLPSEPYAFDAEHRRKLIAWLADTPAARDDRVYLIDGSLITWHGTRLAHALRELPGYFTP